MNILVITQMYSQPDDIGDNKPTRTVNYFVKEWVSMGHDVVVVHCSSRFPICYYYAPSWITDKIVGKTSSIIPSIESSRSIERMENGARVFRIPLFKLFPGQPYSRSALHKCCENIIGKLGEMQFAPEIIIGHFANPSAGIVSYLARYYEAKSSIVFHGDCTARTIKKYRLGFYVNDIGAIGTRSYVEADLVRKLLFLEKRPFVCCSGVPTDVVQKADKICTKHNNANSMSFLYVGSLISRKHVDSVMLAFDKIYKRGHNEFALTIVGGGNEEDGLKRLHETLESRERITFTGRLSRELVFEHMQKADVFTLISDEEVYGMVYIEAMLQGCIVIASKRGGFDGIIKNGINGFLCDPGDSEMLSSIYQKIINMPAEERNTIGQAAIDTAVRYSEREVAERYLNDILCNQ